MTATARDPAKRVLVVDDHIMNCMVLDRQLAQLGFSCDIAEDGATAELLAAARHHIAVILDFRLPDTDGIALAGRLRAMGIDVPLIGLTADPLADPELWPAAGVGVQLSKPLALGQLRDVLEHLPAAPLPCALGPRPPVNFARLAEILGSPEPTEHYEVLQFFCRSTAPVMDRLEQVAAARDRDALRDEAHRIKGAAANAGCALLSDLMGVLERRAASADPLLIDGLVAAGRCQFSAIARIAAGETGVAC